MEERTRDERHRERWPEGGEGGGREREMAIGGEGGGRERWP